MNHQELETLIPQKLVFQEREYASQMDKIRNLVGSEIDKGCKMVTDGRVSEAEYYQAKSTLVEHGRSFRRELLEERHQHILDHQKGYERALAGVAGSNQAIVDSFTEKYTKLAEAAADDVVKAYELAQRTGDEVGIRAAGLVGHEKSIREIESSYRKINPQFYEIAEEKAKFEKRFFSDDARALDWLGVYRQINAAEFREHKEEYQVGFDTATKRPLSRNRFTLIK